MERGVPSKHESARSRPIRCAFCSIKLDCLSSHCFTTLSSFHHWLIDYWFVGLKMISGDSNTNPNWGQIAWEGLLSHETVVSEDSEEFRIFERKIEGNSCHTFDGFQNGPSFGKLAQGRHLNSPTEFSYIGKCQHLLTLISDWQQLTLEKMKGR
jgi:hypothetical protein